MYQSLSKAEYPSLDDFLTKSREVADSLTSKHKNDQKNNTSSKNSNNSANSKPTPATDVPISTLPTNVSTVAKTVPLKRKVPRRKKSCMFCSSEEHFSSRCPVYFTAEA